MSADDDQIVDHAAMIFRDWETHMADVLVEAGVDRERGAEVATLVLAACEGPSSSAEPKGPSPRSTASKRRS